ncbi:putative disks large-like protein 5-like [Microtus ochrogaster]|uniref:Putative disks large-like protein 5-like n=1 Tax=Microtus ochrogaster TaxID=79684 RepID=A0A8J6G0D3_MICOH|nr:putative disks large-like protein 5-like [Microtus ochrogaster]
MLLSKKQIKKEEERLTTELQLMTREKNDLKDRLMILTEGAVDNRYETLQTHLEQATVQDDNHLQKDLQEELGAELHPQQY